MHDMPSNVDRRKVAFRLLVAVIVVAVVGGLYGIGRWAKSLEGPSAMAVLADRAGCTNLEEDGHGYADSNVGHCDVDNVVVTLTTFGSNADRDRWIMTRRAFGALTTRGDATVCLAQGDRWVLETSSPSVCSQLAESLGGRLVR